MVHKHEGREWEKKGVQENEFCRLWIYIPPESQNRTFHKVSDQQTLDESVNG
jgi:hypothetical protein